MRATAVPGASTRAAGISSRPVRNAPVTTPLRARVSLQPVDETIGDPPANRFAGAKHEVRKRGVEAGSQDGQPPGRHEIVGQPVDEKVPVVVEAEEAETDAEQIPIRHQRSDGLSESWARRGATGFARARAVAAAWSGTTASATASAAKPDDREAARASRSG